MDKIEKVAGLLINSHLAMFLVALLILPISALGLMTLEDNDRGSVLSIENTRSQTPVVVETEVMPVIEEIYLDQDLYETATGQSIDTEITTDE